MPDIFEALAPTGEETEIDISKNYKEEFVGEGKKYSTEDAAFLGLANQEMHIKRLERENATLRQTTAAQQSLESLVTKLAEHKSAPVQQAIVEERDEQATPNIEETLNSLLTRRETEARHARNAQTVKETLVKTFGPNYVVHLTQKASELGMSTEAMNVLAAQSPAAFLTLVGAASKAADQQILPPTSSMTTQARPAVSGQKTRSYYRQLMKSDLQKFLSPSIQNEMHEQATRLGDAFQDVT